MTHHRRGLRRLLKDDDQLAAIEQDFEAAGKANVLSLQRVLMLRYASKLTLHPESLVEADVVALREEGWTDRDILEIAEATAYYAYVNRIAQGLGVNLEGTKTES